MPTEDSELQKLIASQWSTLTDKVKELIKNNTYQDVVETALEKAQITSSEVLDTVSLEVLLTLLNLQSSTEFTTTLEMMPELSSEQKKVIVGELTTNLFSSIPLVTDEITEVYNQENIAQRLAKLPEKVRNIILSDDIVESIRTSTASVGLEGGQKKACIEQITLVATGLSTTKEFKEYITTDLQIDAEKVAPFFESVVTDIFNPIREALLDALGKKAETKSGADTQKSPSTEHETAVSTDPYREQPV